MPVGVPVTPETRDRIILLIAEGKGRNAIAREAEVSVGVVTRIAREIGHVFDWKQSDVMLAAAEQNNREIRERLQTAFLVEAVAALDAMHAPHEVIKFETGYQDEPGEWRSIVLDQPSPDDQRRYATIAAIAVDKANVLARPTAQGGAEAGASILEGFAALIRGASADMDDVDPTETPDPNAHLNP